MQDVERFLLRAQLSEQPLVYFKFLSSCCSRLGGYRSLAFVAPVYFVLSGNMPSDRGHELPVANLELSERSSVRIQPMDATH